MGISRVRLIVNTRRMARRLRDLFDAGPSTLMPKIHLVTDLDDLRTGVPLPAPVPALQRRLELIQLVSELLDSQPDLNARASLYDLSDSLAALLDEMRGEGVPLDAVLNLDVSDQSGHWERAKTFIGIADAYLAADPDAFDAEARHRQTIVDLASQWAEKPPAYPIIVAGSTGSRGAVSLLMQAVAKLPQGAIILPGFDFEMPGEVWSDLSNALLAEDHPQYRFQKLAQTLDVHPKDTKAWAPDIAAPDLVRNRWVSLAMRPAPVTDAWLVEGPKLEGLAQSLDGVTILNAESPRAEAMTIAMRLRQAAEDGQKAALITPDRMLTRQVSAALDRWDILPDDSAGTPLQLSPPGRLLRHVADLFRSKLDAEALLTVLKHPLTHTGQDRNTHLQKTRNLELRIRKRGLPYPEPANLRALALTADSDQDLIDWVDWIANTLCDQYRTGKLPLGEWARLHRSCAESIAAGSRAADSGGLWDKAAGEKAHATMENLSDAAGFGGDMTASEYADLVGALLSQEDVRDRDAPLPGVMIWGTMEARVQGADLVILGGMNDGTWPEAPAPDPWLNRNMRNAAGLLLPERRIGLAAHDFQQAVAAPEVWITRSVRSEDAETIPSRWINRMQNLLEGLPKQGGPTALKQAVARGDHWLAKVRALEKVAREDPAPRPAPAPPVAARPRKLFVTEIKRLIRDPYAIYAKHCLRLRPLGQIVQDADARLRGILIHTVLERFLKAVEHDPSALTATRLNQIAADVLAEEVPWPTMRSLWLAKIARVADWFVDNEKQRRKNATPLLLERQAQGNLTWPDIGFSIGCFADRIDQTTDGAAILYDYKSGNPPTRKEQTFFDKQLLIEAAMLEEGAFDAIGSIPVQDAVYIGLGSSPKEVNAPLDEEPPAQTLAQLRALILAYQDADKGFVSRRAVQVEGREEDYDQLARFGEWDTGAKAETQVLK